jgi:hypothetical protein
MRVSSKNHKNASLFDFQPLVNSKGGVYLMPCCLPYGKAGGLQIRRCQEFAVDLLRLHPWRLGSEALRLLQGLNIGKGMVL